MGKSSLNNGSCTLPHRECPPAIADGSTWSSTVPRRDVCCDATLVSPITRTGHPQPGAADTDGAVLRVAERRKWSTYPELCSGGPQELVVLGSELGGRWHGGLDASRTTCYASGRKDPALRHAAAADWSRRWWACQGPCSRQSARHWGRLGPRRSTRAKGTSCPRTSARACCASCCCCCCCTRRSLQSVGDRRSSCR